MKCAIEKHWRASASPHCRCGNPVQKSRPSRVAGFDAVVEEVALHVEDELVAGERGARRVRIGRSRSSGCRSDRPACGAWPRASTRRSTRSTRAGWWLRRRARRRNERRDIPSSPRVGVALLAGAPNRLGHDRRQGPGVELPVRAGPELDRQPRRTRASARRTTPSRRSAPAPGCHRAGRTPVSYAGANDGVVTQRCERSGRGRRRGADELHALVGVGPGGTAFEVVEEPFAASRGAPAQSRRAGRRSGRPGGTAGSWRRRRRGGCPGRRRPRGRGSSAASIPSVTKWNVVPPCIVIGGRAWCVRTKTGWWNGGSSPHQPRPGVVARSPHGPRIGPNMLRPMIVAPMPTNPAATKSSSTPVSPTSSPPSSPAPIISLSGTGLEHPLVQAGAAGTERVGEALVGAGAVAVDRDREVVDAELGHRFLRLAGRTRSAPGYPAPPSGTLVAPSAGDALTSVGADPPFSTCGHRARRRLPPGSPG